MIIKTSCIPCKEQYQSCSHDNLANITAEMPYTVIWNRDAHKTWKNIITAIRKPHPHPIPLPKCKEYGSPNRHPENSQQTN